MLSGFLFSAAAGLPRLAHGRGVRRAGNGGTKAAAWRLLLMEWGDDVREAGRSQARCAGQDCPAPTPLVSGELHAARAYRLRQATANKSQGRSRSIALRLERQRGGFPGKFLPAI